MTGWRLGYALSNPEFIAAMTKIHQYTMLCAPITAQIAAIEAIKNGQGDVAEMVKEYNQRRHLMIDGFKRIGLSCFEPKGAFYIFSFNTGNRHDELGFCRKNYLERKKSRWCRGMHSGLVVKDLFVVPTHPQPPFLLKRWNVLSGSLEGKNKFKQN